MTVRVVVHDNSNSHAATRVMAGWYVSSGSLGEHVCWSSEVTGDGRCWWHPTFRRVNILPEGLEFVWYNAGDPVPAELRVIRTLSPNQAPDCTIARPQSAGTLPTLERGDLSKRF